jgi:sRNA-binding carbon storage regulator CsrA
MFVASRKVGESVTCTVETPTGPATIVFHYLGQASGLGRVKIGIDAPPEVKFIRTELLTKLATSEDQPAPTESGSTDRDENRGHSDTQEPAK